MSENIEGIKLQVSNNIEIRKHLWTVIILITGGIISLLLNLDTLIKIILFIIGLSLDILALYTISEINLQVNRDIQSLLSNKE